MDLLRTISETREWVAARRRLGHRIGFVPTMGALHAGHLSLVETALRQTDAVIVSLFVNPTQFGPNEDFNRYPRDPEGDQVLCHNAGVAAVFYPEVTALYAPDHSVYVVEESLSRTLCGPRRPGHFRGVLTIVAKLFNIVQPDVAVFGQKDFQQARLIQQMVLDLDFPVRIIVAPTRREPDGLAMSSRNRYLTAAERRMALCIPRALESARMLYAQGERDVEKLIAPMMAIISATPQAQLEYLEMVDYNTLQPVPQADDRTVAALALRIGKTRLIDNTLLAGDFPRDG